MSSSAKGDEWLDGVGETDTSGLGREMYFDMHDIQLEASNWVEAVRWSDCRRLDTMNEVSLVISIVLICWLLNTTFARSDTTGLLL